MPRPRKKDTVSATAPATDFAPDTVLVTVELDPETYKQIEQQAESWGYTIEQWLMESIAEKL